MADSHTNVPADEGGYWRSLRELYDRESVSDITAHEFMGGVTDDFDLSHLTPMSRKRFLATLSASAAFAAAGCTNYRDKGEIVPYTRQPEGVTPGVPNFYASTCTGCAQRCGILVKTREGRPIKIDGNPDHPVNLGRTCAKGQASILHLYDPARLRAPAFGARSGRIGEASWDEIDELVTKHLGECVKASREIALVSKGVHSPTFAALLADFAATFPGTRLYTYDPLGEGTRIAAWEASYATRSVPAIAWDRADVILALESDFLGTEGNTIEATRRFTSRRDVMTSTDLVRLYAVEGSMSLTGANADYRLRLSPDRQLEFVLALLRELTVVRGVTPLPVPLARVVREASLQSVAGSAGLDARVLSHLVDDLLAHRGSAIVHAGRSLPQEVHTAVNYLNEVIGASPLYEWGNGSADVLPASPDAEIVDLVRKMKAGDVGCVIHLDANPAYDLPTALDYAGAVKSVPLAVSLVEADDETSQTCSYVLPVNHALESWGDHFVRDGVLSLQQPIIAPIHATRQKEAVLLQWMKPSEPYRDSLYLDYLKARWEKEVFRAQTGGAPFESFWHAALHDGVARVPAPSGTARTFLSPALEGTGGTRPAAGYTVALVESPYLGDGSFAGNGWLQEIPHPISKIVWDNYAAVSPGTAAALSVASNDLIDIQSPTGRVTLPAFVQPGQADGCITVAIGYGRRGAGPVGTGIGFDVSPLMPRDRWSGSRILHGLTVTKAAGTYELVSTQEHHSLDDTFVKEMHTKRKIIRERALHEFLKDPELFRRERHELFSISKEVTYDGLKWAMAIDLNKCTGCNACVSGCTVENNIPVVGKDQVARGREMQWIRIDRYYGGTPDAPALSHQPMLCQHCDNAPCENVCPVVATTHSPDGLNQMTYNRCVGTKYCSNNCPYKVRRFNFYDWRDRFADGYYEQEPIPLAHNPDVTVRSRGVMEKCTFCVQRIADARQRAVQEGRPMKGSDVTTACQQACPAQAIVFGDMNDPASDVARYRGHALGYHVLEELNVRPNVTYLARLRNTHPESTS